MSGRERWRQHLNELMTATLDPIVYAVQWARDPRCIRSGANHRRVGLGNAPACPLWEASPVRERR